MSVNPITSATGGVTAAIRHAAEATGVDFDYLLGQAKVESGLRANAHARTSSASGLYQFIDQSWLAVVKKHGAEHGLGWAADAIEQNGRHLSVSDPATRQAILQLRNDPAIASLMAAEHASDNQAALEASLGRDATGTDLYMAHFLGLGGARSFLRTMAANPSASGAALFPSAAAANRGVFYDHSGAPRTLAAIYQHFADKLGAAGASAINGATAGVMQAATDISQLEEIAMADGSTVIPGAGQSATSATQWAEATLDRLNGGARTATASLMRPTPATAKLAYLMLANLGV